MLYIFYITGILFTLSVAGFYLGRPDEGFDWYTSMTSTPAPVVFRHVK